ncbi:hypothetical protein N0V82_008636 [Gnomoniopsis sp. IMI 355080]|nr:hypothetical protein N0V82_008636 [Gnomoniopsis sp. IMI 355080]
MACDLCSNLVVDYRELVEDEIDVPFFVEEFYPGLSRLARNAKAGCEFCDLLIKLTSEYFDVTERSLERPVRFQLRNARFRTRSYHKDMSEELQKSADNGVYSLAIELVYGDPTQTNELYFSVYSNDDRE